MSGDREQEGLAIGLASFARSLMAEKGVQATLDRIVEGAVEIVEGCQDASIMLVRRRRAYPVAVSSDLARSCDLLQGELREGPCWEAAQTGQQILRIVDLTEHSERWPHYADQANKLGVGSTIAFLLFTEDEDLGSLNLYSRTPGALTDRSEQIGWLLASHAAVALSAARSDEQLHAALSHRDHIGQAVGILIERHSITAEEAFALLSCHSQNHNIKVSDLAEYLIAHGDLPTAS